MAYNITIGNATIRLEAGTTVRFDKATDPTVFTFPASELYKMCQNAQKANPASTEEMVKCLDELEETLQSALLKLRLRKKVIQTVK